MFKIFNNSNLFVWIEKLINFINSIFFVLVLVALSFALIFSPPDYLQGDSVRIMYVHVPAAWIGLASFTLIALLSILNFIFKIISASESQKELKIVDDQTTSLNFAGFLAEAVLKILKDIKNDEDKSRGVFNLVGPNCGSWYDFAKFTQHFCSLKGINSGFAKINIVPVNTEEMNFKAKRPKFSHLSSDKIKNSYSLSLPNWEKSIEEILS